MNKNNSSLYMLLLVMGAMNSAIVLVNGLLAKYTNMYLGGLIVHLVGFIPSLMLFLIFDMDKLSKWNSTFKSNKKIFTAGFMGSIILLMSAFCMSTVGVFVTSIAMVAGQFVLSVIIDINGYFGFEMVKLGARKTCAIFIIALGIILISI
ncbi:MAG: DMT family transporter [Bacillota bacterium]